MLICQNVILPQKVIFLELQKEDLQQRLQSKNEDKIEQRGLEYLLELQQRTKAIIKRLQLPYISINANLPKTTITQQIINFIKE